MYLGKLHSIVEASNVSSVYIVGDWNACIHGKVFGVELHNFCSEFNYVISDRELANDRSTEYTYVSDAHGTTSWLDHCVSTSAAHNAITDMCVLHDYVGSDHLPLKFVVRVGSLPTTKLDTADTRTRIHWSKLSELELDKYVSDTGIALSNIDQPTDALLCKDVHCPHDQHKHAIDKLYNDITNTLRQCSSGLDHVINQCVEV
jgi:hypothetical protein